RRSFWPPVGNVRLSAHFDLRLAECAAEDARIRGPAADRCRRDEHPVIRKPAAGIDDQIANGPAPVVETQIHHAAEVAVRRREGESSQVAERHIHADLLDWPDGARACLGRGLRHTSSASWVSLLSEGLLHLADLPLSSAGNLFSFAVGLQLGVVCQFPDLCLHRTLHFVNLARHLILATWLHDASSLVAKSAFTSSGRGAPCTANYRFSALTFFTPSFTAVSRSILPVIARFSDF